jgi:hypothetical protein
MNIFVLDQDPIKASKFLCDKHCVKMVLETSQILCTIRHKLCDTQPIPYRKAYENHPACIWAGKNMHNYTWLCQHGLGIASEYTFRYGKIHKCQQVISDCFSRAGYLDFPDKSAAITPFAQCMPEEYRCDDAVQAYRTYYIKDKLVNIDCRWTKREIPKWLNG